MASRFGEVRIVAPDVEMSSADQASKPLTYTPADCVALGAHQWQKVDVVLAGINLESNLGNSMWHSGTLAAAKQASLLGLRGIALSAPVHDDEPKFEALAPWVEKVLASLRRRRAAGVGYSNGSGPASGVCAGPVTAPRRRRAGRRTAGRQRGRGVVGRGGAASVAAAVCGVVGGRSRRRRRAIAAASSGGGGVASAGGGGARPDRRNRRIA